jgi:hypothetical protein
MFSHFKTRKKMDIQEITKEIKNKLNHAVATKVPAYAKTLIDETEDDKESKVSLFITDLTFQVSDRVIKEKISRMNPKPVTFTFHINRGKYLEQTVNELMTQINQEVYFDEEVIYIKKKRCNGITPFVISLKVFFLKDYGYMGSKHIAQTDEIVNEWFPAILSCMRIKNAEAEQAEEMLTFLKEFVVFGFQKALNMTHVFVDMVKMDESMFSIEYVSVGDKKLSPEEFKQFREENLINKKKK